MNIFYLIFTRSAMLLIIENQSHGYKMKPVLLVFTLLSLLLPAFIIASPNVETTNNPAVELIQSGDTKQTPDEENKITPTTSRGQLLYEHHCLKCHESNIHILEGNKARNVEDVKGWIVKWQAYEKLNWDQDAINAVTEYIVKRYYKFE